MRTDIARYRAEIARLEATTGADILREAMGAECPACNDLEDARQFMEPPREPTEGLDLRTCIGAQCEAVEDIAGVRNQGQHFIVLEPGACQTVKIRYMHGGRYYECYVGAVQPARLLKPHAGPRCDEGTKERQRVLVPPPSEWCDGSGKG